MASDKGVISAASSAWLISALGGLFIVIEAARAGHSVAAGGSLAGAAVGLVLIGIPGAVLLYGGYRLPDTDLHPAVYPRITAWTLGGFVVMLGVVALVELDPSGGLERPFFSGLLGTVLGSAAGFGIGSNESRAISRAKEAQRHRVEAEKHRDQLRRERDLRDRIVQTSPIGITIVDPDGSIRMANEYAARIVGLSKSELEGLNHYDHPMFEVTDADGNAMEGGMFQEILTTKEPIHDVEREITRADGQRIWLSLNGAPLRDPSEDVTAVIVAFEDITDRKEHERKLKESNERLEQFAYGASHDLKEPLRMVSSYLQLLENRYKDDLDEDAREFIEFAVDGADRMQAMIESLLDYSRITTHGEPLEPTDAEAVLEDVLDDLQLRIEETNASITTDDLPTVNADSNQLMQLFQNLISNALTYSSDEPPKIHVGVERAPNAWRFTVADEGVGIDLDQHDRIFEVFETGHTAEEGSGSGIGLALCDRIVERHGGDIWVESEPGHGSTFYFTIPRVDSHAARDEQTPLPNEDIPE